LSTTVNWPKYFFSRTVCTCISNLPLFIEIYFRINREIFGIKQRNWYQEKENYQQRNSQYPSTSDQSAFYKYKPETRHQNVICHCVWIFHLLVPIVYFKYVESSGLYDVTRTCISGCLVSCFTSVIRVFVYSSDHLLFHEQKFQKSFFKPVSLFCYKEQSDEQIMYGSQ
jgi:hypothetical protein